MASTSKPLILFFVAMMLLTGCCNTLLSKYQDNQCVRNCDDPDPNQRKKFEQPVLQTVQMFIGEMGCWLVVGAHSIYRRYLDRQQRQQLEGYQAVDTSDQAAEEADSASIRSDQPLNPAIKVLVKDGEDRIPLTGYKVTLLALPAVCDICGTTLMNVGLLFVVASIFQMTRGALVLFVGLFSVLFLKKRLRAYEWFALVTVVIGVGLVGLAGAIYVEKKEDMPATTMLIVRDTLKAIVKEVRTEETLRTILGIFLIAGAQIFTATQFVLEEFILRKYSLEPIRVVGWEGLFGFLVTVLAMVVLHFSVGRTESGQYGYFDAVEGWREVTSYKSIGVSSVLIMISIGGFNFFGLSVTRSVSATSRSTIDTCRTLFIWIVSLGLGWETFKWLQVLGFALLVYGTFLFNGIVHPPLKRYWESRVEHHLPEEATEHT